MVLQQQHVFLVLLEIGIMRVVVAAKSSARAIKRGEINIRLGLAVRQ